jgi:NADH dehydrogenase FAD-containing subunit
MRLPNAGITLVSDSDYFSFKPNTIYVPFGMDPGKLTVRLAGATRRENIGFLKATAREIDPVTRRVYVEHQNGALDLPYDYLVVATGVSMRTCEIPGLNDFSSVIWVLEHMLKLRADLRRLAQDARAGERRRVLFLMSPHNKCVGPLYEMALMLDTWLRRKRARREIEIAFSTYEERYIEAFGPRLHEVVTNEFCAREIAGHPGFVIDYVEPGNATYRNGERLSFDLLISFPPYAASARFDGLPTDERGFIATELATRQVVGHSDVYAVGDTADYPLKQAFMAFLQADVAAEHLSARILGTQPRLRFDPMHLSEMEDFDRSALTYSFRPPGGVAGIAMDGMETSSNLGGLHRIGSSLLWTPARRMRSAYLPWRFKAGNPFHADAPWKGLEAGLTPTPGVNGKSALALSVAGVATGRPE